MQSCPNTQSIRRTIRRTDMPKFIASLLIILIFFNLTSGDQAMDICMSHIYKLISSFSTIYLISTCRCGFRRCELQTFDPDTLQGMFLCVHMIIYNLCMLKLMCMNLHACLLFLFMGSPQQNIFYWDVAYKLITSWRWFMTLYVLVFVVMQIENRRLLEEISLLDYDYTEPNPKHDPRNGHP